MWDRVHNNPMPNYSGKAHEDGTYEYQYYYQDVIDDSLTFEDCDSLVIYAHNFDSPNLDVVSNSDEIYNDETVVSKDLTPYVSFSIGTVGSATYCKKMECRVQCDASDLFNPGKIYWHDDNPEDIQTTYFSNNVPNESDPVRYIPDRVISYNTYITLEVEKCYEQDTFDEEGNVTGAELVTETERNTYYYHFRNDWSRTQDDLMDNVMPKCKR